MTAQEKQRVWIWWRILHGEPNLPLRITDDFKEWSGRTMSDSDKIIEYELGPDGTLRPVK